jgi:hypothetical protein
MARKIELKVIQLPDGNGRELPFSYAAVIVNALRFAHPQQGLVLDEVLRAVDAQGPVLKAIEDNAGQVTLSEEQYRTLLEKIDKFPFGVAAPEIAEFGLYIRNVAEIGREIGREPDARRAAD